MVTEAEGAAPHETGGMLLGYIVDEAGEPQAVIEMVIGPGPRAKHERTRFIPDGRWQQAELEEIYSSPGPTTYVGDWHTHPGGGPSPSHRDARTASSIARRRRARCPHPLMAILTDDKGAWSLTVHCYGRGALYKVTDTRFFG